MLTATYINVQLDEGVLNVGVKLILEPREESAYEFPSFEVRIKFSLH